MNLPEEFYEAIDPKIYKYHYRSYFYTYDRDYASSNHWCHSSKWRIINTQIRDKSRHQFYFKFVLEELKKGLIIYYLNSFNKIYPNIHTLYPITKTNYTHRKIGLENLTKMIINSQF